MRTVALFDLDGTITHADTMLEYLAFVHGRTKLYLWLISVSPIWILSKLGLMDADAPKRALIRLAFTGRDVGELEKLAYLFTREVMPGLLRTGALERIWEYKRQDAEVLVVTASCSLWVAPWCEAQKLGLLATELEAKEGRFTGRLATPNCRGQEKVRRIRGHFGDLSALTLHAYGDTFGDRPMLALAQERHYKPFRVR